MFLSRFKWYWLTAVLTGVLIVVVILIVAWVFFYPTKKELPILQIGSAKVKVELALTPDQQRQGLSGRVGLTPDTGMLFVFPALTEQHFWMKDMKFPLDFIWITHDQVVQIDNNIQPPNKDSLPQIISPYRSVGMVLEVTAGWAERNNIKVGDKTRLYLQRYY